MKTSLIVLTLNEFEGFKKIMPKVNRKWVDEIIVIDGGSTDGTPELAKKMGYKVITQRNRGRGEAFRLGLEKSKGDLLVYFSPDGNEDPKDIPKLLEKANEGYDMVIASRFGNGSKSYDATFIRLIGNKFFTLLINMLFGLHLSDAVNGFRAITRKAMESIKTDAVYFDIEIQMTMRCARKGYKISEIPTIEYPRVFGKGKLSTIKDGFRYLKLILIEFFKVDKK
jgi:glycosyltransferase involved in cell wall biosynthesis